MEQSRDATHQTQTPTSAHLQQQKPRQKRKRPLEAPEPATKRPKDAPEVDHTDASKVQLQSPGDPFDTSQYVRVLKGFPALATGIISLRPMVSLLRKVVDSRTAARGYGPRTQQRRGRRKPATLPPNDIEIEARLGTLREDGRFVAGVDSDVWYTALELMQRGGPWDPATSHGWREDHVTYYVLALSNNEPVRTISSFERSKITVAHQHKKLIKNHTLVAMPGQPSVECCGEQYYQNYLTSQTALENAFGGSSCAPTPQQATRAGRASAMTGATATTAAAAQRDASMGVVRCRRRRRGCDVRVSLSHEERVLPSKVPDTAPPQRVAIRQRRRFAVGHWGIDFTMVWAGNTTESAEIKQHRGDTQYHIEVECIDPAAYLDTRPDDGLVAASILMRIADLADPDAMGRNMAAGVMPTAALPCHYHTL